MTTTNSAMIIEWGMPIEGRETKALEEFMVQVAWWEGLKAAGTITGFRTYGTLTGDMASRSGFLLVEGSQKQIAELQTNEEFRTRFNRVSIVVHNVRLTVCETNDDMMTRMQRYGKSLKDTLG